MSYTRVASGALRRRAAPFPATAKQIGEFEVPYRVPPLRAAPPDGCLAAQPLTSPNRDEGKISAGGGGWIRPNVGAK